MKTAEEWANNAPCSEELTADYHRYFVKFIKEIQKDAFWAGVANEKWVQEQRSDVDEKSK